MINVKKAITKLILEDKRISHCKRVAEYMYESATQFYLNKHEMYTLGLLHDIGYMFVDINNDSSKLSHTKYGGNLLRTQGYKYWKEVMYHGLYHPEYSSDELLLLNQADSQIDSNGVFVGYEQRLADILKRYGDYSIQYITAKKLIDELKTAK